MQKRLCDCVIQASSKQIQTVWLPRPRGESSWYVSLLIVFHSLSSSNSECEDRPLKMMRSLRLSWQISRCVLISLKMTDGLKMLPSLSQKRGKWRNLFSLGIFTTRCCQILSLLMREKEKRRSWEKGCFARIMKYQRDLRDVVLLSGSYS